MLVEYVFPGIESTSVLMTMRPQQEFSRVACRLITTPTDCSAVRSGTSCVGVGSKNYTNHATVHVIFMMKMYSVHTLVEVKCAITTYKTNTETNIAPLTRTDMHTTVYYHAATHAPHNDSAQGMATGPLFAHNRLFRMDPTAGMLMGSDEPSCTPAGRSTGRGREDTTSGSSSTSSSSSSSSAWAAGERTSSSPP